MTRALCFALAVPLTILPPPARAIGPAPGQADLDGPALLSAIRAARDEKDFERAEALVRTGLARFPQASVWPLLLALILADQGKRDEAFAILGTPAAQAAPEKERLLARAYAERRVGRAFDALRHYFGVLALDATNTEAREAAIAILREIRAPFAAARLAAEQSPELAPALAADMAAAETRWGALDATSDPRHRFDMTDRALGDLDRLIVQAQTRGDSEAATRLRLDRMVALRDRVRMAEVIAEAERLRATGQTLPAYAREALADALLYMRRPEEARTEYEAVLEADPGYPDAGAGRFYASVEMEDFAAAFAQADALLEKEPVWRRYRDDPGRYPNDDFVEALLRPAAVRFYGDQPAEAWTRITEARAAAPANPSIRLTAASIMNARKWPQAAEQENRIALTLAPSFLPARVAVAESALGRSRWKEARRRTAELTEIYPEYQPVQRLKDQLAADTGWQLEAEIRPSHENGGGLFGNAGNELESRVTLRSPFVSDDGWRLFGSYRYANSHPPEGFANLQRMSAGVQLVVPDGNGSAAITQNFGTLARTGFAATADWIVSDHIALALAGERISAETPLRAILNGIAADSLSSRFTYTWNEAHGLSLGAGWMTFTDGNQRATADARYGWKLIAMPHFGLTAQAELYGSTNSGRNAPYYNPPTDGSASLGLVAEHIVWRRYENSLVQALTLDGGVYGEQGYRGGAIGTVSYEHRWRFDPWRELVYGVSFGRRLYDGEHARELGAFLTLREKL